MLQHILLLPTEDQAEMVQHIVSMNLTSRQIRDICQQNEIIQSNVMKLSHNRLTRFIVKEIEKHSPEELAKSVLQARNGNNHLAIARLRNLIQFAEEATKLLVD